MRNSEGVFLTVETLPGKVVVQQSRRNPHDAQDEQSEEQQQDDGLIHPCHDALRKQARQVHARKTIGTVKYSEVSVASLVIATFLEPANPSDSVKK